jgi:PKD repeat protein
MTMATLGKWGIALLALAAVLPGALGHSTARAARFCGLGQTATMMANQQPALSFPLTPQSPANSPVGQFGLLYPARQAIAFTEDLSRLPTPVDPAKYQWEWDFGDGAAASGYHISHSYAQPGTYTIIVQLIDPADPTNSDPNFDSAAITIVPQVLDNPPVAHGTGSGTYVQLGGTLSYDASGSTSPTGGPLTYTWNFGDSTIAHGVTVSHVFSTPGKGFVALIVQNAQGARAMALIPVIVAIQLPVAVLTTPSVVAQPGQAVAFDASRSQAVSQPGESLATFAWNFGDGATLTTTTPHATHTYAHPGNYLVTLRVTDTAGLPGTTTLTIIVQNGSGADLPIGTLVLLGIIVLAAIALGVLTVAGVRRQRHIAQ